jgi:hypothetical protein
MLVGGLVPALGLTLGEWLRVHVGNADGALLGAWLSVQVGNADGALLRVQEGDADGA